MIDRITEIKSRIRIEDFIKRYLQLNKMNKALCPFHQEKTPSFSVNRKKQVFKCFGCHIGGDVIEFYQHYFRVDKATAINELYESISGKSLIRNKTEMLTDKKNKLQNDFIDSMSEVEKDIYYERAGIAGDEMALKEVKKFRLQNNSDIFEELSIYCNNKMADNKSKSAMNYLLNSRQLKKEWLERFRIFVIGNYNEVNNHLKKRFTLDQLKRSGLYNGKGNLVFFKHRIIIPYLHHDKIIYLRGRYFDDNNSSDAIEGSKYIGLVDDSLRLNSAKRFFNTDMLNNILPWEKLYITEGEFDAIVLSGLGKNAICIPGVGNIPSKKNLKLLQNNEIIYCGDNDTAGKELMNKLVEIFLSFGKNIFIKNLNGSKDINDFIIQFQS